MAIKTEMVNVPGPKGGFEAYLAIPEKTPAPGVIVIQEVFGVNAHIRSVTERVAQAGYTALAPDLYWTHEPGFQTGYSEEEIAVARKIMGEISLDDAVQDVAASMTVLRERSESIADKTGVVGFCWGGLMTYLVACRLDPTCSVAYYGGGIAKYLGESSGINAPMTFHFGEQDGAIPMDQVEQIKGTVKDMPDVNVHTYPPAGHGFHCDMRGSYDEPSAKEAWGRTVEFFGKHLS